MPATSEAKCSCNHCSEHIAFEPIYAGQMTTCPHCGMETKLFIPSRAPSRAVHAAAPQENVSNWIVGAYVAAFLFPLLGLILGINLFSKKQPAHAVAAILLSLVASGVWYQIFLGGE